MRSSQVKLMQRILSALGFLTADSATGYYGNATVGAVKKFQLENNLVNAKNPNFGFAGPATRKKMNEVYEVWYMQNGFAPRSFSEEGGGGTSASNAALVASDATRQAKIEEIKKQIQILQAAVLKLVERLGEVIKSRKS